MILTKIRFLVPLRNIIRNLFRIMRRIEMKITLDHLHLGRVHHHKRIPVLHLETAPDLIPEDHLHPAERRLLEAVLEVYAVTAGD